uniref:PiggyBac transposable element-derived protein domain-containing protein n=1 Tax=Timema tahoe TaxID=61484 RepID=A0A7R9IQF4_9NEOP|nr:unnamed protein product [Timema tahoe]
MLASEAVVMNLSEPLLNKGYAIHTDNWYSSPTLFKLLLDNKTYHCIRNCSITCLQLLFQIKLSTGEVVNQSSNNILCLKLQDKKDVLMLSTMHDSPLMTETGKTKRVKRKVGGRVQGEEAQGWGSCTSRRSTRLGVVYKSKKHKL